LVMQRVCSCFLVGSWMKMWITELRAGWCIKFGEGGRGLRMNYKQGNARLQEADWKRRVKCSFWLLLEDRSFCDRKDWWKTEGKNAFLLMLA
jgi:hypothetical protein